MAGNGEMEVEHLRKVFVGGLDPRTTDDSLRAYFAKYGELVDCVVMKDQDQRSRGFGFVAFDHSSCVDKLQSERPHVVDGKTVDSKRVVPKSNSNQARADREQKVNKLFIGGLRDQLTDETMKQYFEQNFGEVEKLETFIEKETGKRKGFAFVTFADHDSADKCVLHCLTAPGNKLDINGVMVEARKARSQEEMRGGRGGGGPGMRGGGGFGGGRGGGRGFGGGHQNGGGYNQGGGYHQDGYGGGGGGGGFQGGYGGGGGGDYGGPAGGGYQGGYGGGGGGGGGGGYGGGGQGGYGGGGQGGYGGGGQGGYGGGYGGGRGGGGGGYANSQGGGPMRGGYNKQRQGPYGGGGGGGRY